MSRAETVRELIDNRVLSYDSYVGRNLIKYVMSVCVPECELVRLNKPCRSNDDDVENDCKKKKPKY